MKELPQEIHKKILALCEEGNIYVDSGNLQEGLDKFRQSLDLLPEPREDWEAATWILSAIGDTYYFLKDYEGCIRALSEAINCPGGLGNPFIHLRLGESYFELNDTRKALDELTRAYMGGGLEIFEQEDPKYLEAMRLIL